ncbi:hypothetical protein BJV74DRAFT_882149 [Russula compacta]|nr:hypothetical protein BJV74DRAFT_882149 [Russula compacta]
MPRVATHKRSRTLALRIQFNGLDGLKVSSTGQGDIQSLVPWLRDTLKSLRLPHPKPTNIVKPSDATSIIDMYWDVETGNILVKTVIDRCSMTETSTLQERSIGLLMVTVALTRSFVLPANMREISSQKSPAMTKYCPFDNSTTCSSTNSSLSGTTELEARLVAIFESIGLSIPNPVEDLAGAAYIPKLTTYIQTLRSVADSEAAARAKAEATLAEERARHARVLQDIRMECREPFVVPALLDAFVRMSEVVDGISDSQAI